MTPREREDYIKELEDALRSAIWITDREVRWLTVKLGVTKGEANILAILFKARGIPLHGFEVEMSVPITSREEDGTSYNVTSTSIHRIRRKLEEGFIHSKIKTGYWLPPESINFIAAIMKDIPPCPLT
jgi:DNA-binding response OmpR family regulator